MAIQLRASNCKPFVRVDLHLSHHHYVVSTIERRRRIIVIEIHRFESWQAVKMVFCPVPDVTKHIIKPHGGRRVHVDRLCVCACVRACVWRVERQPGIHSLRMHAPELPRILVIVNCYQHSYSAFVLIPVSI